MKAAEVLRLYEAGRRDFKGISLRGQNFKGKDLSGADFSQADIRSANFTNANLTETNFAQAKAGLQRRWAAGLMVVSLLLSVISGFLSAFAGHFVALLVKSGGLKDQVTGWVSLAVIVVFLLLLLRKGIGAFAAAFAVILAIAIAFVVAIGLAFAGTFFVGTVILALAIAAAAAVAFAGAGAIVTAIATATATAIAAAAAFAGVIAVAVAFVGAIAAAGASAGVGAGAMTLVSAYIGWRALKGDKRDTWLRSAVIAFAAIGGTSFRGATLTDTNFSQACLKSTDFRRAVLLRSRWRDAEKLDHVRPGETYLNNSKIRQLVITGNGLAQSYDHLLNLVGLNLQGANLIKADFTGSTLKTGTLQGATLTNTYFIGADLNRVNLQGADLSNAQLIQTQLDQADLTGAILTGACTEDWNVNNSTKLAGITCDYIYLKSNQRERRPSQGTFKSGEFAALFQQAIDTVDLIFKDGIDWQAFFQSFQDLRDQYADQDLSIQAIEKKRGGAFVVRVEVAEGADKTVIESRAYEIYETKLAFMEQRYREVLQAKDGEIVAYKEQSANLMKITELLGSKIMPSEINQTFHAPVANAAVNNHGMMSAIQNNYGSNTEDITRLLTALRDQAQNFPTDKKDDTLDTLEALQDDIAKPEPDQGRIGRRLKKLVAIATLLTGLASGAATTSGDLTNFTNNVIELTEKLGIPIEQVQLPPSSNPSS